MPDIGAIEPAALKARLDRGDRIFILDVREPFRNFRGAVPRRESYPDGRYPVAPDRARSGPRDRRRMPSWRPQRAGRDVPGAAWVSSMCSICTGGIDAWSEDADPSTPRY